VRTLGRTLLASLTSLTLLGNALASAPAGASTAAVISLSPSIGPPTSGVTVTGTDFGALEVVDVRFDTTPVGRARSDPSGAFSKAIRVPASAVPGIHTIGARGRSSHSLAFASFLVRTNWTDYKFDAANTGFNPYENVLSTSNVGGLQLAWSTPTGSQITSAVAVADGFVFAGSTDNHLYAMDPDTGAVVWNFRTGGDVEDPAVGDGRVYVYSSDDNIYAVDEFTGHLDWQTPSLIILSPPVEVDGVLYIGQEAHDAATGALLWISTALTDTGPAIAGGIVYEGGANGDLYALDATTGDVLWATPTGASQVISTPAISNGVVYVEAGTQLHAFDASTGAELWHTSMGGQSLTNSPAVGGGVVYTRASGAVIRAFDATTGAQLWGVVLGGGDFASAPVLANGVLYTGGANWTLFALDAESGDTVFTYAGARASIDSPAVANGTVYYSSVDGTVYALGLPTTRPALRATLDTATLSLDPAAGPPTTGMTATGSGFGPNETVVVRFDATTVAKPHTDASGAFSNSIVVPASATPGDHAVRARGTVSRLSAASTFLVRTDWTDYKFDAANSSFNPFENVLNSSNVGGLQLAWSTSTGQQIFSSVAVANGLVYTGSTDNHLYAMDPDTGTVLWTFLAGDDVQDPAVGEGRVYAISRDGNLYAVDAFTGALIWQMPSLQQSMPPVDVDGVVYIGSEAHDAATGALLWTSVAPVFTGAAVTNGVVYEGGLDGDVYALDAATGAVIWASPTGASQASSVPAVANGVVYAEAGSQLLAFDAASGTRLWQSAMGGTAFTNSPAVGDGVVYTRASKAVIRAFDSSSGALLWNVNLGGGSSFGSAPALADGVLYAGSNASSLVVLDATDGSTLFTFQAHANIDSPAVVDGKVYVASQDDTVYAFGL
jgi:outer membrane protein assembly factor BamB